MASVATGCHSQYLPDIGRTVQFWVQGECPSCVCTHAPGLASLDTKGEEANGTQVETTFAAAGNSPSTAVIATRVVAAVVLALGVALLVRRAISKKTRGKASLISLAANIDVVANPTTKCGSQKRECFQAASKRGSVRIADGGYLYNIPLALLDDTDTDTDHGYLAVTNEVTRAGIVSQVAETGFGGAPPDTGPGPVQAAAPVTDKPLAYFLQDGYRKYLKLEYPLYFFIERACMGKKEPKTAKT